MEELNIKLRQKIALLAALFMPFIAQNLIKDNNFELSKQDIDFIKSYIIPWYIALFLILNGV